MRITTFNHLIKPLPKDHIERHPLHAHTHLIELIAMRIMFNLFHSFFNSKFDNPNLEKSFFFKKSRVMFKKKIKIALKIGGKNGSNFC